MTALLQARQRAQRLGRLFREVEERTGSTVAAAGFVARLVRQRIPIVLRQAGSVLRHKAASREITDLRARIGDQTAFLGFKVVGGIGDQLVIARFLRDLAGYAGDFAFDIYQIARVGSLAASMACGPAAMT
jgi:hypothetical protein